MDQATPETAHPPLVLTRVLNAPRELVFRAWTEPQHLEKWWGPHGFDTPVARIDLRPGGEMRLDMRAPDGAIYIGPGEFREISPPDRLVFTSGWRTEAGRDMLTVLNTVTFEAEGNQTKLTLEAQVIQAVPEAAGSLAGMREGWSQSLEKLETLLATL